MIIVSWNAFVNQIFKNIFASFSMGDSMGDRGRFFVSSGEETKNRPNVIKLM